MTYLEREASVRHVRIDRDYAPHDFVGSGAKSRHRNVEQRMVKRIQMQIAFIHFFA